MSPIHGIGLFADEPIAAGTVIWRFHPKWDVAFTEEELAALPAPSREQVDRYGYFEEGLGAYVLCGDDARFINHSATPNTTYGTEIETFAVRAIAVGEEITYDYRTLREDEPLPFLEGERGAAESPSGAREASGQVPSPSVARGDKRGLGEGSSAGGPDSQPAP